MMMAIYPKDLQIYVGEYYRLYIYNNISLRRNTSIFVAIKKQVKTKEIRTAVLVLYVPKQLLLDGFHTAVGTTCV
jgi:hypothetical protein